MNEPTILIRAHRGGFAESMATVEEIPATLEGVIGFLTKQECIWPSHKDWTTEVEVNKYGNPNLDVRNGWSTYIVLVSGNAVAFTNGPTKDKNSSTRVATELIKGIKGKSSSIDKLQAITRAVEWLGDHLMYSCTSDQHKVFMRMYSHDDMGRSVHSVLGRMNLSQICLALFQVANTLDKNRSPHNLDNLGQEIIPYAPINKPERDLTI